MSQPFTPEAIGRRFHRSPVPTLIACSELQSPIFFSHVVGNRAMPAPTLAPPVEDCFAIHVHHEPFAEADVWIQGRHTKLKDVADGSVVVFDLRTEPTAQIHQPFEFSRFQISRSAIDELAYEHRMRHVQDLRQEGAVFDPVVKHLSLALLKRLQRFGPDQDRLFADAIGQAFFIHVARTYGGARSVEPKVGALAPWQARRVADWVDSDLDQPIGVADLAAVIGLSPSHFSRAFLAYFGAPPHKWVMQRRIERAKHLLADPNLSVLEIAIACGFADQSHFTRAFTRLVNQTPGRWRRAAQR